MGVVLAVVLPLFVVVTVAATYVFIRRTSHRAAPLCRYERRGGQVVVHVDLPWWIAYVRTLSAPVADVTGARVVEAGERVRLWVRVCGVGLPGFYAGWFWRRGGLCYVTRRLSRDAVRIDLARGRVRHWIVEVADPDAVVADLAPRPVTT
jgi:hypothetical protein